MHSILRINVRSSSIRTLQTRWQSHDLRVKKSIFLRSMTTSTVNQYKTQNVDAPLTSSATFLVFSVREWNSKNIDVIRSTLASTSDLIKNINIRDNTARFACTLGIGSLAWDNLFGVKDKPKELHPFQEIRGKKHTAISTPADLFYHIRSDRRDLCFEFERQVTESLGDSVSVQDVTIGFRYFDTRDLLGFVDGTANPQNVEAREAVIVTDSIDTSELAHGGSYILIQKYTHNMQKWNTLPTEKQEAILGRRKFDNTELEDAGEKEQKSHKTLCTISAPDGGERAILRDNMPFGSPAAGTFGTYFIGYSRELWVIEQMLKRMYCGEPDGLHDRTLDYSTPQTGSVFFAPSLNVLDSLGDD